MATVAQQRRGNKADRPTLATGQVGFDVDKNQIIVGGNQGNVNVSRNPITNKMHDGTIVSNRISFLTDGIGDKGVDFEYEENNKTEFKVASDVIAPVTMVIDNGAELPVVDLNGDPVDIVKNQIYVVWFTENAPQNIGTPVFQSAPRGGGGSVITGDVTPIYGKQGVTSSEADKTIPLTIVGQPYIVSERNQVRLENGELWTALKNGLDLKIYKSLNNGDTQILIDTFTQPTDFDYSVIDVTGGILVLYAFTSGVGSVFYDSLTGNRSVRGIVDSLQLEMSGCGMVKDSNGDIHVYYESKYVGKDLSFNVSYSKSIDEGVTWESPTRITNTNSTGSDNVKGSIVIGLLERPVIAYVTETATTNFVSSKYYNGSSWSSSLPYNGGVYTQGKTSMDSKTTGVIGLVFSSKDSTHNNDIIKYIESVDGGVSWGSIIELTTDSATLQTEPSITRNSEDDWFVMFTGVEGVSSTGISVVRNINGVWGSPIVITTTLSSKPSTVVNFREFTETLTSFMDGSANDVKFRGKWGSFTVNEIVLATVLKNSFIYLNETTILNLSGGGTQNVPSINTATNETALQAVENGTLSTTGGVQKQYVGSVTKDPLGFTPI